MEATVELIGVSLILVGALLVGIPSVHYYRSRPKLQPDVVPVVVAPPPAPVIHKAEYKRPPLIKIRYASLSEEASGAHGAATSLQPLFVAYPGLETFWNASRMWKVNDYVNSPWTFNSEIIDPAEYLRYEQLFHKHILEVDKETANVWLNLNDVRTDVLAFAEFGEYAMQFGDKETLDDILTQSRRLFPEPEHHKVLLDLTDKVEIWKEQVDANDVAIGKADLVEKYGTKAERREFLFHWTLSSMFRYYIDPRIIISICRAFIRDYKMEDADTSMIRTAWEKVIKLTAQRDGAEKAELVVAELEKETAIFNEPDELRKTLRSIRATVRDIGEQHEKYDATFRTNFPIQAPGLLLSFYKRIAPLPGYGEVAAAVEQLIK